MTDCHYFVVWELAFCQSSRTLFIISLFYLKTDDESTSSRQRPGDVVMPTAEEMRKLPRALKKAVLSKDIYLCLQLLGMNTIIAMGKVSNKFDEQAL